MNLPRLQWFLAAATAATAVLVAACSGTGMHATPATMEAAQDTDAANALAAPDKASSLKATVTLKIAGGDVTIRKVDTFDGTLPYAANDAKPKTTLTLINSGSSNAQKAPTPKGLKTLLFLTANIDGKKKVTFKTSKVRGVIASTTLRARAKYALYLYEGKKQVGKIDAGSPSSSKLQFTTPLSARAIAPSVPLAIELVETATPKPTAPPTTPPPPPTAGPLEANPTSLSFGTAATQTFTATESNYSGKLTASSSNTAIATVNPASAKGPKATFTVTPVAGGKCTITVSDAKGKSVTIAVSISSGIFTIDPTPAASPTSLTFDTAATQTFTVQETSYSAAFTESDTCSSVASVTPTSANGPNATFTVTPLGGGTCTISVGDDEANVVKVGVSVSSAIFIIDSKHGKSPLHGGQ